MACAYYHEYLQRWSAKRLQIETVWLPPEKMSPTRQSWVARVQCPAIRLHQLQGRSPLFRSAERQVPVLVSRAAEMLQNEEFLRPSRASGSDGHAVYVCWMLVQTLLSLSGSSPTEEKEERRHTPPPRSRR
ncbi:hypothetical protein J3458_003652 [Metarhizium acridum]|uniref:uncharacterized protein n=1 Tax=Metarhizium acridum TaxID=92637 RepID=UPI001C6BF179|nr:hypothetical protein J3458_003652 [Metarhizium acridum]